MKMKPFGLVLLTIALGLSLSACGCFQQAMKGETAPPPAPSRSDGRTRGEAEIAVAAPAPRLLLKRLRGAAVVEFSDIYFDFDKYNVRPGDGDILKKNYDWFSANRRQGKDRRELRREGNR